MCICVTCAYVSHALSQCSGLFSQCGICAYMACAHMCHVPICAHVYKTHVSRICVQMRTTHMCPQHICVFAYVSCAHMCRTLCAYNSYVCMCGHVCVHTYVLYALRVRHICAQDTYAHMTHFFWKKKCVKKVCQKKVCQKKCVALYVRTTLKKCVKKSVASSHMCHVRICVALYVRTTHTCAHIRVHTYRHHTIQTP